jgi:hypothetical protein
MQAAVDCHSSPLISFIVNDSHSATLALDIADVALLITLFPYLACDCAQRYWYRLSLGRGLILARQFSLTGYRNEVLVVQPHGPSITRPLQLLPKEQAGEPEDDPGLDQYSLQSWVRVIFASGRYLHRFLPLFSLSCSVMPSSVLLLLFASRSRRRVERRDY